MAISRRTIKQIPRKFVKQDGGLVQYGLGGTIAGAGAVASMIPTPWTQIGGAALSVIGGVVGAFEEDPADKAAKEEQTQQSRAQGNNAQAGVYNPFRPTFAMGGKVGEPETNTIVKNNLWTPQTRLSIYPELAKRDLLGHGVDSVSMQQWQNFTPEETLKYTNPDEGIDYTKGNTANPGGFKYWSLDEVPTINSKSIRSSGFSDNYLKAKKNTKYAMGGQVPSTFRQKSDSLTQANKDLPWVKRFLDGNKLSIPWGDEGKTASHQLSYGSVDGGYMIYPNLVQQGDSLVNMGDKAQDYARKNNTGMFVQDSSFADAYSKNGLIDHSKYAMGGVIPGMAPNVNVEGGEVIQGADGSVAEVKGSKHSQGGVNLHMEDGGRVFSNRLINLKTGNTFAEDADILRKMIK